jgi:hypothetical protein
MRWRCVCTAKQNGGSVGRLWTVSCASTPTIVTATNSTSLSRTRKVREGGREGGEEGRAACIGSW